MHYRHAYTYNRRTSSTEHFRHHHFTTADGLRVDIESASGRHPRHRWFARLSHNGSSRSNYFPTRRAALSAAFGWLAEHRRL